MTDSWTLKVSFVLLLIGVGNLFQTVSGELPLLANAIKVEPDPIRNLVTLRVTVTDNNDEPITGLNKDDFQLLVDNKPIAKSRFTVTPALESPTPTKLVILLDTSNSMEQKDSTGIQRKKGAIDAIESLQKTFRNDPVVIKLIPFGEDGEGCKSFPKSVPSPVAKSLVSQDFVKFSNSSFAEQLSQLKNQFFCTSTDLYHPLIETIKYLQEEKNKASLEEESPSKFAIILLSDGFHSHNRTCNNNTDEQLFNQLRTVANQSKDISIYTIGYGLSPSDLEREMKNIFNAPNPPLDSQSFICQYELHPQYTTITKKFIDHQRLEDISSLTNEGEYKTFESAEQVSEIMEKFVRTILGRYEIKYRQKLAREGEGQTNKAVVKIARLNMKSEPVDVKLNPWSLESISPKNLLISSILGIAGVSAWIVAFIKWSKSLKQR